MCVYSATQSLTGGDVKQKKILPLQTRPYHIELHISVQQSMGGKQAGGAFLRTGRLACAAAASCAAFLTANLA